MKSIPSSLDPKRLPALEQLRVHCERGGPSLLDRVYAEAQALHACVRELGADDLVELPKRKTAPTTLSLLQEPDLL